MFKQLKVFFENSVQFDFQGVFSKGLKPVSPVIIFCALLLGLISDPLLAVTIDDVHLKGVFKQGGLIRGKTLPGAQVAFNDRVIGITPEGDFVFGFGRDAALKHKLKVTHAGNSLMIPIEIKKRVYNIQKIEGVPKKTVSPSAENLKRIRTENQLVTSARKTNEPMTYFLKDFIWPLTGRISGVYGSQRFYNGEPRRPHFGVDVAAQVGTEVYAPNNGLVTMVHPDMFYSGGTLIIDHGYGISSSFLHLHKILVKKGDKIKQGQPIALVGSGGRSTGPHLDWRINWFKVRIDPELIVPSMDEVLEKARYKQ